MKGVGLVERPLLFVIGEMAKFLYIWDAELQIIKMCSIVGVN